MTPAKAFIVFLIIALWSFGPAAHRAAAGFDAENVDVLTPTSAWLVGPATLTPMQNVGFAMPCLMMNQYNNGFVVRISGGGERIMAMAIDFSQDVFKPGDTLDMQVVIGAFNMTIPATALNESTLLFDMQSAGGIYKALVSGKYMDVSFASKSFTFALLGVTDGLRRIEQCYDPDKERQAQQQQRPQQAGFSTLVPGGDNVPPAYRAKNADEPDSAPGKLMPIPGGDPAAASQTHPGEQSTLPAGGKGQASGLDFSSKISSLDQAIASMSARLNGVEPAAGATRAEAVQPKIDIQVQPQMQSQARQQYQQQQQQAAVQARPIGRPLANSWAAPFTPPAKGLNQTQVMPAALPGEDQGYMPTVRRWRALSGSNMREVLDVWAASENVRLVWQSDREYAVQRSFSIEGTFEQVVANLLTQYEDERVRPAGRIYFDPEAQQKVLLVESY